MAHARRAEDEDADECRGGAVDGDVVLFQRLRRGYIDQSWLTAFTPVCNFYASRQKLTTPNATFATNVNFYSAVKTETTAPGQGITPVPRFHTPRHTARVNRPPDERCTMSPLERFSKWVQLKVYQVEVTYSVYIFTPAEKFVFCEPCPRLPL